METRTQALFAVPIVLSLAHGAQAGEPKWTKNGTKVGVTVYTTPVDGSDVPRVKAVTTISAATDEVWDKLGAVLSKTKGVKEIKKLGSCGENCEYIYQRLGHALIKDRHYVLKMKWTISEKDGLRTYRRSWVKTEEKSPIGSGALVIEKVSGSWTLSPTDCGQKTRVTYVNHMDLGGSVPAALFEGGFIDSAYKLLAKLRSAF